MQNDTQANNLVEAYPMRSTERQFLQVGHRCNR